MALGMKDLEFAFNLGKEHMIEKIKEILMAKDKSIKEETGGHHSVDAYTEMALEEQLEDLEKQLDEIYESVVGDEGRERYTHEEFIQRLLDIYDDSQIFQRMEDYRDKRVSSD